MKYSALIILMTFAATQLTAQYKYEKEVRIKERYVPQNARDFVDQMELRTKIKWYQEFGKDAFSFEAKTIQNGTRYSIEFSGEGVIEDVEIEVKSADIPYKALKKISDYLNDSHEKYLIDKIQVQYSGSEEAVLAYLRKETTITGLVTRYEIVISTKEDGQYKLLEYLFSENGSFINCYDIVLKNTDNLEY